MQAGIPALFAAGLQHHQAGRPAEAARIYRKVLAADPNHVDSLHLLGLIQHHNGCSDHAIALIRRAIGLDAQQPVFYSNLGTALWTARQAEEAIAAYQRAIALRPDYAQAHFNLGTVLWKTAQPEAAASCFHNAIRHNPNYAEAHNNLGVLLSEQGDVAAATTCFVRALQIRPSYPEALNSLGSMLTQQDQPEQALACYRAAIAIKPDYAEAHFNIGTALLEQGQPDEAAGYLRSALSNRPDYVDALDNLGSALRQQGQLAEAVVWYRRAVRLDPDHAGSHTNLALALLARGDLEEGWREHEWRWQTPQLRGARRGFPQPQWLGEAADGRTLLIHAEQGFGDTLQFCRYASLAAERGFRVILEVQPALVRLLRSLAGPAQVVTSGEHLPAFDLHCPMMSLPLAFGTTLDTIPGTPAYLHADPVKVEQWRARLGALPGRGRRIGLVWAGNPRKHAAALAAVDRRRSLPPALLAPLVDVADVQFFSLQKDGPAAPPALSLIDHMAEMTDFADTAALVANLDLVISVDTAVAHLAAALGKPVWLMDRFDACWRWLIGRRDSPWYPTIRLYRQQRAGDWNGVIREIADDLRTEACAS